MNAVVIGLFLITMVAGPNGVPATTNNDDSCEITVAPAATLLLPFFDVNITALAGTDETTVFTVTNVTSAPQIAHVTVWSDWAYPVLTFNVFLTGYDLQTINLHDVLVRGVVAPRSPGESGFIAGSGSVPGANGSNPNFHSCYDMGPPATLPPELLTAVQTSLTVGLYNIFGTTVGCLATRVGGTHSHARGYITIDVVADCTSTFPTDPLYYSTQILFDNVLIGDYQQLTGDATIGTFAKGNPMVHIRAIPEGGPAGSVPPGTTNLPYTFYDRYTPAANRKMDRRVPLPSTFAARWIEGNPNSFETSYKIWREGLAVGTQTTTCSSAALNSGMVVGEVIRFDQSENSFGFGFCSFPFCSLPPQLPASIVVRTSTSQFFPSHSSSPDVAGWIYLDLNSQPAGANTRPSQNWVVVSMAAQGRYSVDFDAAHFGNGCTAAAIRPNPDI